MDTQSLFETMEGLKKSDFNSFDHSDADIYYDKKQKLSEYFLDIIDSYADDLTGEQIWDCFKSSIKSAYKHSKKEYEKFKYLMDNFC